MPAHTSTCQIVPGLHQGQAEVLVAGAGEGHAGLGGEHAEEVQGRPDSGTVHILDARVDVVAAGAHVVEADRVEVHWSRGRRRRRRCPPRVGRAAVAPHLVARVGVDDLEGRVAVFGREAVLEDVGRLDHMIVD